jgi:hypothetical protein
VAIGWWTIAETVATAPDFWQWWLVVPVLFFVCGLVLVLGVLLDWWPSLAKPRGGERGAAPQPEKKVGALDFARFKEHEKTHRQAEAHQAARSELLLEALQGEILSPDEFQYSVRVTNIGEQDVRLDAYAASEVDGASTPRYGHFNLLWEGTNEKIIVIRVGGSADIHVIRYLANRSAMRS